MHTSYEQQNGHHWSEYSSGLQAQMSSSNITVCMTLATKWLGHYRARDDLKNA